MKRFLNWRIAAAVAVSMMTSTAMAATIVVDTLGDAPLGEGTNNGDCSLRDAILSANLDIAIDTCTAGQGDDQIIFDQALAGGMITFSALGADEDNGATGDLDIFNGTQDPQQSLSITGPLEGDPAGIIIDSDNIDRIFHVLPNSNMGIIEFTDITIQGGETTEFGAGVAIEDELSQPRFKSVLLINNVINAVETDARGGGIFSTAPLTLLDTEVVNNSASSGGDGFGVAYGGGVYVETTIGGQVFNADRSSFRNNLALARNSPGLGGGIYVFVTNQSSAASSVSISRSEFSRNAARGRNGLGGGVALELFGIESGALITNTTISRNTATGPFSSQLPNTGAFGGGLFLSGGIDVQPEIFINNSTIVMNTALGRGDGPEMGGGIRAESSANVVLTNTILALNSALTGPDCAPGIGGAGDTVDSEGFNLIGNTTDCNFNSIAGDQTGSDDPPLDPRIDALADNGGPTLTHALLFDSPALDAGNPVITEARNECSQQDQRGFPRPADADNSGTEECDIGAFELQVQGGGNMPPQVIGGISDQNLPIGGVNVSLDLSQVFNDPEGDPLFFEAISDNPDVVEVEVSENMLTLIPGIEGTALVTVTAFDSAGQSANIQVKSLAGSAAFTAASGGGEASLGGGSGGGCSLTATDGKPDPLLWLLTAFAALGLTRKRRFTI